MTAGELLARVQRWRAQGWLRRLDGAFAGFIHELDPQAPPSLLLACALLAHVEGQGHSGLPLADLQRGAHAVPGWPLAGLPELDEVLKTCGLAGDDLLPADWQGRPVLQIDPEDEAGNSPLVISGGLLYLRRYWRHERRLAAQVQQRTVPTAPPTWDVAAARTLLDRLFPAAGDATPNWQKVACALALRGRLSIVTGGPGTGKTYTAARLLVLLQALHDGPHPLRVALAGPTGKAAARLRQSIDTALQVLRQQGLLQPLQGALAGGDWSRELPPGRTLHALLGARPDTRRYAHDASRPLDIDLLFVDEASMVHLEMMAALLDALPAQARVVLLGDKDQLASVEAGAVIGELCATATGSYDADVADWIRQISGEVVPSSAGQGELAQQIVVLRESHRYAGAIGQLARAVNAGQGAEALAVLRGGDAAVSLVEAGDAFTTVPEMAAAIDARGRQQPRGGYKTYLDLLAQRPADAQQFDAWARSVLRAFDGFRVLCAVRKGPCGVEELNAAIEKQLAEAGLLARRGEWYEGRPVMVTRNDRSLGVFNGDIGIVLRPPGADGSALRCHFLDGDELRSVAVGRLADVETAYAMTVHKSQGSEFEHVVLVLPEDDSPLLTRELVYTGITRARSAFTLVSRTAALLTTAATRRTRRISGLRAMLDPGGRT